MRRAAVIWESVRRRGIKTSPLLTPVEPFRCAKEAASACGRSRPRFGVATARRDRHARRFQCIGDDDGADLHGALGTFGARARARARPLAAMTDRLPTPGQRGNRQERIASRARKERLLLSARFSERSPLKGHAGEEDAQNGLRLFRVLCKWRRRWGALVFSASLDKETRSCRCSVSLNLLSLSLSLVLFLSLSPELP